MNDIQTLCQKGQRAYQRGYYQNARDHFNQALQLSNNVTGNCTSSIHQELQHDLNLSISMTYCCQYNSEQALHYCDQARNIAVKVSDKLRLAKCHHQYGEIYIMQNSFPKAMQDLEKSLELKLQVVGDNQLDVTDTYRAIGRVNLYRMELPQAKEMFDKSLAIRQRVLGDHNFEIAELYHDIGDWYNAEKKFNDALAMYEKSLKILLITIGRRSLHVSKIYCSIGWIYGHYMKRCYDARTKFDRALKIQLNIAGENSIQVADTYYCIAYSYFEQDDINHCLTFWLKAARIQLKLLTKCHLNIAESFLLIGHCYYRVENYHVAYSLYGEALRIKIQLFGIRNISVAQIYQWIALTSAWCGNKDKAQLMVNKSFEIYENIFDGKSKYIAYSHSTLAECYHAQKRHKDAIHEYQKALDILLELQGGNRYTLDVADIYYNVSSVHNTHNSLTVDIQYMEKCINIYIKILGQNNVKVANYINEIAFSYSRLQQYDKAIIYYQKMLGIVMQLKEDTDLLRWKAYYKLAKIYAQQNRNVDAISMYEKCLHYNLQHYGEINERRPKFYEELEKLYRESNEHSLADRTNKLINDVRRGLRRRNRAKEPVLRKLY